MDKKYWITPTQLESVRRPRTERDQLIACQEVHRQNVIGSYIRASSLMNALLETQIPGSTIKLIMDQFFTPDSKHEVYR